MGFQNLVPPQHKVINVCPYSILLLWYTKHSVKISDWPKRILDLKRWDGSLVNFSAKKCARTMEKRGLVAQGGAVAHLVGQLATIQEVRGSIPSPGQDCFSLLRFVHPALNEYQGLLRPGQSKRQRGKQLQTTSNAVCQEQSGRYS
ncbi:hypothetical protein PoB_000773400 [Plakobranchus ocellatus]|uniref:Uncharacterized protein n=1 Tax=Plakobranchus ocellatus TaxID=259542 RepID=A0AAV3YFZ6_9GAST|nr:hypothetical protein PoB_000773400 [Plakobranchus ocellatus]